MQTEARALLASLLLHLFFVGGAVGLVSLVPPPATLMLVDFSVEPGPPGTGEDGQKGALSGSVPFPKPPVSARLVIPVDYILE